MSAPTTINLGYEVGTGTLVTIPLGHMAVTGQTQAAGKTTTLEALAHRSDRAVLAFVTKRGEGSFGAAPGHDVHATRPYFRERADWQFVEAILEATLRERMKFERGWIMKITRGAATLHDVQRNCQRELEKAKAQFARDMYEKLLAYLDIVVPQIGRIRWDTIVHLRDGLNVMNLDGMSTELQSLVIASCLDFIMEHQRDVTVIIPEAWEFVPRGRKSPVTLSAESFVRKGAALRNYLWIDSQDLAGVHTPLLKQMHVFLLGVQREINEIKRTIAHLHGPAKPKPQTIAQLGLGQFVACWGGNAVTTYVRPWWAQPAAAQEAARMGGRAGVHDSVLVEAGNGMTFGRIVETARHMEQMPRDYDVTGITGPNEEEAVADRLLEQENTRLTDENTRLKLQLDRVERELQTLKDRLAFAGEPAPERRSGHTKLVGRPLDDDGKIDLTVKRDVDDIYTAIVDRLMRDQQVIAHIAATRPELIVETTPRVQAVDGSSLKGRVAQLIAKNWIDSAPKRPGEINKELNRTGGQVHPANLGRALNDFVLDGFLTRESDGYARAAGIKVSTRELTAVV